MTIPQEKVFGILWVILPAALMFGLGWTCSEMAHPQLDSTSDLDSVIEIRYDLNQKTPCMVVHSKDIGPNSGSHTEFRYASLEKARAASIRAENALLQE